MSEHKNHVDFDGLVVESHQGNRILALPIAVLEALRYASVIQYRRGGSVYRMRVDSFLDGRRGGQPVITQAQDVIQEHVREVTEQAANSAGSRASWPTGSAPTPEYGAPQLPVHGANAPSPTTPPAPGEEPDPANIPLRVRREGKWVNTYVTRTQYEQYVAEGRIRQEPPTDHPNEGTQQ